MKILQFPSPSKPLSPKAGRRPETDVFDALLNSCKPQGASEGPGGLVLLENLRARQLPPAGEVKEAGHLIGRLDQAIRAAPRDALSRIHNLEGLIYIYGTSP